MDSTRMRSSLLALAAAPVLAVLLAYVSSGVDRPPVILRWEAQPAHVGRDEHAVLRVAASDPDGGALRYDYKAERGRVTIDAARVRYSPPPDGGSDRVTLTVTDGEGLRATATLAITADGIVRAGMVAASASAEEPMMEAAAAPAPPVAAGLATPADVRPGSAAPSVPSPRRVAHVDAPVPPPPEAPSVEDAPPPPEIPPSSAPEPSLRHRRGPAVPVASAPAVDASSGAAAAAEAEETPPPNHAPVLEKGTKIEKLGTRSIVLVAQGYEPDGDPIEHEWDTKGCFDVLNESDRSIEVKLGYCAWSVIRLTWRDPHGATAVAEWTLSK